MRTRGPTVVAALAFVAACGPADSGTSAANAVASPVGATSAAVSRLTLPSSATAVTMARPALPAKISGDCPGPDPCEFGRTWDVCEALPVYAEARDGAVVLRTLKPDEPFVAKGGEIELVSPGKIRILQATDPADTGGLTLAKNTIVEAYGPLQTSRALYYDPNSGKGWSPPAATDQLWYWDGKIAQLVEAPKMTWWVKAKLNDGKTGWLKLKSDERIDGFPIYGHAEGVRTWDINLTRDDETPDCAGLLAMRAEDEARR